MTKKFITTGAFPEPEWTQVPNKFFDMLPEMEASEALTTLILIRETYGYHRESCKMSIPKLAAAAGISENSVKAGAEMAERRGTFRRSNPEEKTTAEWELVTGSTIDPSTIEGGEGQPLMVTGSTIDPQVRVKEIKEINKEIFENLENIPNNYPIDWYLTHGLAVPADWQDPSGDVQRNEFERALGFGSLPWGTGDFERFSKWVIKTYDADPSAFQKYADWRKGDGKYNGMNNKQIRMNPMMFVDTGYPTYLASVSMYSSKDKSFGL